MANRDIKFIISLKMYKIITSIKKSNLVSICFFYIRIVYSFCTGGKDLGVWYDNKSKKTNDEMSGADQLCILINDYLNKHLSEEVTKVTKKIHSKFVEIVNVFLCFFFFIINRVYPKRMRIVCYIIAKNGTIFDGRVMCWMAFAVI